jgi:hypothetical protein
MSESGWRYDEKFGHWIPPAQIHNPWEQEPEEPKVEVWMVTDRWWTDRPVRRCFCSCGWNTPNMVTDKRARTEMEYHLGTKHAEFMAMAQRGRVNVAGQVPGMGPLVPKLKS